MQSNVLSPTYCNMLNHYWSKIYDISSSQIHLSILILVIINIRYLVQHSNLAVAVFYVVTGILLQYHIIISVDKSNHREYDTIVHESILPLKINTHIIRYLVRRFYLLFHRNSIEIGRKKKVERKEKIPLINKIQTE